jgi:signal transduction histidine kinase
MCFPAALLFFAVKNIRQHYKTSFENFKSYLPLFISIVLFFVAEEFWEIDESFLHQNPFPSIADLFYISFYPFFTFFMIQSLRPIKKFISKKIIIFGSVLAITLLIPTVMATYDFNSKEEPLSLLILISYPIFDAVIFAIAVIGLLFTFSKSFNFYWIMLLGGVILWVFADTLFLYAEITDTYYDGYPGDILFIITYILLIFAIIYDTKNVKAKRLSYNLLANNSENKITFSSINKFAIPVSLIILIAISFYIMFLSNLFEFAHGINEKNATPVVGLLVGIIVALSSIIVLINKNLGRLVKLKEIELQEKNNELRKIEKLSAIGQVTARLAHDLRNPLATINNCVSVIAHKQKTNQKLDDREISTIMRAVFRMAHQTDDILDFLKDAEVVKSPNHLKDIINSCLPYLPQRPEILIHLPKDDAMINCNSSQIERVFVNLILNSMQEMESTGDIFIRIKEESNSVKIELEDTGQGVLDQNVEKLFEPLFTTKQKGTGLGLTCCKKIITSHGGVITFKNNPTTFTIVLPKE